MGQNGEVKGQDDELRHLTPVILPQPTVRPKHVIQKLFAKISQTAGSVLDSAK